MCLIAFNWQPCSSVPLIIAANRDEYFVRPTLALHSWVNQGIVAGMDLRAGGTWLGVSAQGRVAALTNYRDPTLVRPGALSRGEIATAFLSGSTTAAHYLSELASRSNSYSPFNLLVFDGTSLMGFESRHRRSFKLPEGVNAVSNSDFNTQWPKLTRLKNGFAAIIEKQAIDGKSTVETSSINALFALLSDRRIATDDALPKTGIPLDRERALSAEFIQTPDYGTRASSVMIVGRKYAEVIERTFDVDGFAGEAHRRIEW